MAISDVDLKPTEAMARAAERGLRLREEHGRGGTEVGVARARDIKNRKNLSPGTVRRMHSYFSRHAVDKEGKGWGKDSAGYIAWLLWGGDPGESWASRKVKELEKASGKSESSRGELFCPLNVQRYDPDIQEERPTMFSRASIITTLGLAASPAIFAKPSKTSKPSKDKGKESILKPKAERQAAWKEQRNKHIVNALKLAEAIIRNPKFLTKGDPSNASKVAYDIGFYIEDLEQAGDKKGANTIRAAIKIAKAITRKRKGEVDSYVPATMRDYLDMARGFEASPTIFAKPRPKDSSKDGVVGNADVPIAVAAKLDKYAKEVAAAIKASGVANVYANRDNMQRDDWTIEVWPKKLKPDIDNVVQVSVTVMSPAWRKVPGVKDGELFYQIQIDGGNSPGSTGPAPSVAALAKMAIKALSKVSKKSFGIEDACWPGYEAVGMKTKDGKRVPNCVPAKSSRKATK